MPRNDSPEELKGLYRKAAQEYFRQSMDGPAPPETVSQATQRQITLASLDQMKVWRPDLHVFNELQLRYRTEIGQPVGEVVPDNMVVLHDSPLDVGDNYDTSFQPAHPFLVLDYISDSYSRKSYQRNLDHYIRDLKIPYCLRFRTEVRELKLYHHDGLKYACVQPNAQDRYAIPEMELEAGLFRSWVRFWFRGELLPLPADLQRELEDTRRRLKMAEQEVERLRAEIEQLKRGQSTQG